MVNVALIQSDLSWENPDINLKNFESKFADLKKDTDLVVLPETFTTGFTMGVQEFGKEEDSAISWMKMFSEKLNVTITGSIIAEDHGRYYNRLYWVEPEGEVRFYDKRHLFRMAGEESHYTPGNRRVVTNLKGCRFLLQICYDLRFPVFSRYRGDYDAIIYVANFPSARKNVWETLLAARAIENQSYVIGCNRIGADGNGIQYSGGSCIIDMKGITRESLTEEERILYGQIDPDEIASFRAKFPAHLDADEFTIA